MASRTSHVLGGIHGIALGVILIVGMIILEVSSPAPWLIAIGLLAWGGWDIYRAAQGRKKDPETVAEFEQSISAMGSGRATEDCPKPSSDDEPTT